MKKSNKKPVGREKPKPSAKADKKRRALTDENLARVSGGGVKGESQDSQYKD
jgi:hypothetical protein